MHTTMEKGSFTIGSNELSKTIISLKANSRMIKDLNVHSDATIEFTSLHAAKVTVGEEEYDLTFCDVKPTDAYRLSTEANHLDFLGQVLGRFQVTSSRSGVGKLDLPLDVDAGQAERTGAEGSVKKREISVLEVNTGMLPGSSSIPPPKRNKTADLTKRNVINSSIKPPKGSAVCQEEGNVSRYSRDVVQVTKLTSSMILLNHVPVDVSASDVMNSIFAGLSISCIYVCTRESKLQQLYAANTSDIHTHAVVDLYVDFTSISGAELALLRTGEELQYKVNLQSIAGSNASQPSSSSKAGAPNVVRKRCAPHLQEVDQELSFWVKFIGLKLTSSSKVSSGSNLLSMNSTIRKHMEVLRGVLSEIDCAGVVNKHVSGENYTSTGKINSYSFGTLANICNTAHVLLCDPTILRNYWHPVVSQLLLAPGTREAYDRDQERKVRISKDTKYLLSHPAVDDILLFSSQSEDDHFCGEGEISFAPDDLNAGKGFIDDLGEGVYRADQDAQLLQFESFVQEAEDAVQCYTKLWSELVFRTEMEQASSGKLPVEKGKGTVASMVAEGTAFTYIGSTAYGVENFHRKLVLCKLLFKESWGLCTTHCVFDK